MLARLFRCGHFAHSDDITFTRFEPHFRSDTQYGHARTQLAVEATFTALYLRMVCRPHTFMDVRYVR